MTIAHEDPHAEAKRRRAAGQFIGFPAPETNWYRTPNNWTDICATITTDDGNPDDNIPPGTAAACLVLQYVMRHTWGYREFGIAKRITIDEFLTGRKLSDGLRQDRGCGISRATVIKSLHYLEHRGYLDVTRDESDRGRIRKFYALRMAPGATAHPF